MRQLAWIMTLAALLSVAGLAAEAQFSFFPQPLSLLANPPSPSPGEKITVAASTPTFDKNAAFFSWSVDGKAKPDLSGLGKNTINLVAGAVGSIIRISVEVARPGGDLAQASLGVVSSDLALTWFAETYTPKWYRGKALPTPTSIVNIIAIPRIAFGGNTIPSSALTYTWGLDDDDIALSGAGENVFRVKLSEVPKQTHDIRLAVEDPDKRIKKEARLFMVPQDTAAGIYRSSPLGGVDPRSALASTPAAPRGTFDLIAEPFYFPVSSKKSLAYNWNVNGLNSAGSPDNPDVLTLSTNENTGEQILISLSIDDGSPFVSAATRALSLFLK